MELLRSHRLAERGNKTINTYSYSFNTFFLHHCNTNLKKVAMRIYESLTKVMHSFFIKFICVGTYTHMCIYVYNLETLPPETWRCHEYQSRAENLVHLGSSHFPTSRKKCTFAILHRWCLLDYDFCPSVLFTA